MSEMIERAAKALADNHILVSDGHYKMAARTVLQAIREPGKKAIDAGITAAEEVEDWTQDSFERYRVDSASDMPRPVWQAMIDAALNDPR